MMLIQCSLAQCLHELHEQLYRAEDDGGVGVGEPRDDPLADGLGLALVARRVVGREGVQDEHLGMTVMTNDK